MEARTLLQAVLAAAQITLLQVTTGRTKVRAELPVAWNSFRPGTPPPSPDTKTSGEEELSLSVTR